MLFFDFIKNGNIIITCDEWINIFDKLKNDKEALFIIDPPYINSCNEMYNLNIGYKENINIYEYMFNNDLNNFLSRIIFILEDIWIIKILFKDNIKETYKKMYQMNNIMGGKGKKKTNHLISYINIRKNMPNKWIDGLKALNKGNTDNWVIPRKGSRNYNYIMNDKIESGNFINKLMRDRILISLSKEEKDQLKATSVISNAIKNKLLQNKDVEEYKTKEARNVITNTIRNKILQNKDIAKAELTKAGILYDNAMEQARMPKKRGRKPKNA